MATGGSRPLTRHQREVLQIDRWWLLTWTLGFVASLTIFAGAYGIYKATGPHPQVTLFLRQVRHQVRWLIPGLKGKPNAKPDAVRFERDDIRYAGGARPRS